MQNIFMNTTIIMNTTIAWNEPAVNDTTNVGDDCIRPGKRDFIPWDNPDNIITKQQEAIISDFVSLGAIPLLWLVGIVGNVLSAIVFYRQGLNIRVNVCLFSLALADVCTITVLLFCFLEYAWRVYVGPSNIFIQYLVGLIGFNWVSQFLSAVIASERCFCVAFPLKAQHVLSARKMAVFVGVTSFLLLGGFIASVGTKHTVACLVDPFTNQTVQIVYVTKHYQKYQTVIDIVDVFVYHTFLALLFLVVTTVASAVTAVKLTAARQWRDRTVYSIPQAGSEAKMDENGKTKPDLAQRGSSSGQVTTKEAAVTKMLLATNLLFIICLLPPVMVQISTFIVSELSFEGRYYNLITALVALMSLCRVLNSSLNFFVYYAMGSKFRDTLRSILPWCCRKEAPQKTLTSATELSSVYGLE